MTTQNLDTLFLAIAKSSKLDTSREKLQSNNEAPYDFTWLDSLQPNPKHKHATLAHVRKLRKAQAHAKPTIQAQEIPNEYHSTVSPSAIYPELTTQQESKIKLVDSIAPGDYSIVGYAKHYRKFNLTPYEIQCTASFNALTYNEQTEVQVKFMQYNRPKHKAQRRSTKPIIWTKNHKKTTKHVKPHTRQLALPTKPGKRVKIGKPTNVDFTELLSKRLGRVSYQNTNNDCL
jgi:hypothetical protein